METFVAWGPFEEHKLYNRRRDIHGPFGGQRQGGICTPKDHPVIFCFTGETGEQHGYSDGWSDQVFRYFGEGQIGDMEFKKGNRAIRNHLVDGKDLLLFQTHGRQGVRFLGQYECAGTEEQMAPDRTGSLRRAIVFSLVPVGGVLHLDSYPDADDFSISDLSNLRARAFEAARVTPQLGGAPARRNLYVRAEIIRRYVLARAGGYCEACGKPAPFVTKSGQGYLEPHHTRRLSDGGPDDPRHVGAVCPDCHREIHYGVQGDAKNQKLVTEIRLKEAKAGASSPEARREALDG
jgi:5-methylcytosine-specific restriction protein A